MTGQEILYDSDDSDAEKKELEDDVEDENQRPDYSIGVILTYKAQVEELKRLIAELNNDAFKQI